MCLRLSDPGGLVLCHPHQSIQDNLNFMRYIIEGFYRKSDKGRALVQLYQAEAFNRVDHCYLVSVLVWFSLGFGFLRWIIQLYYNIDSIVWVNSFPSETFCIKSQFSKDVRSHHFYMYWLLSHYCKSWVASQGSQFVGDQFQHM